MQAVLKPALINYTCVATSKPPKTCTNLHMLPVVLADLQRALKSYHSMQYVVEEFPF